VNLELSPSEFEEHVMGRKQDWKQSLLVEVSQQDRAGMQQALPLGTWLHQHSIAVDQHGMLIAAKPSRFAREAGLQPQPSLSGPPAHHTARYVPPLARCPTGMSCVCVHVTVMLNAGVTASAVDDLQLHGWPSS